MKYQHIEKEKNNARRTKRVLQQLELAGQWYEQLHQDVLRFCGIDLNENTRKREVVLYRKVVGWALCRYMGFSTVITATVMNKDHSLISYYLGLLDKFYVIRYNRYGERKIETSRNKGVYNPYRPIMDKIYGLLSRQQNLQHRLTLLQQHDGLLDHALVPDISTALSGRCNGSFAMLFLKKDNNNNRLVVRVLFDKTQPPGTIKAIEKEIATIKNNDPVYYKNTCFVLMNPSSTAV